MPEKLSCLYFDLHSFFKRGKNACYINAASARAHSNRTFNLHSVKVICKPNSAFELEFLEAFHIHKNHNNVVNCNFASPPLSDCLKSYFESNFFCFFLLFWTLQVSLNSDFLLVNPLAPSSYSGIR